MPNDSYETEIINRVIEKLKKSLTTGYFSESFVMDIVNMRLNGDINLVDNILNEVKYLEGLTSHSSTKEATKFKHGIFAGKNIWHKHFYNGNFLKNFGIETGIEFGTFKKQYSNNLNKVFDKYNGCIIDGKIMGEIMQATGLGRMMNILEQRSKESRMTGDWIVFIKLPFEDSYKNIYLLISPHNEEINHLYERVKFSIMQFYLKLYEDFLLANIKKLLLKIFLLRINRSRMTNIR